MKTAIKYHIALCLLLCSQMAGEEANPVDTAVLPEIPDGVRLGMSVGELQKIRPKAIRLDLDVTIGGKPPPKPADLLKGQHVFLEEIERDEVQTKATLDEVRTKAALGYGFKDGRCVYFGIEAGYIREEFVRKRGEIIRLFIELFGDKYERRLARKGSKGCSYLAPVFVWKGKQRTVKLLVTSEYPGVTLERGIIQINAKRSDEPDYEGHFVKNVEEYLIRTLFAPLEKVGAPKGS